MKGKIYIITNQINNKVYIGQTLLSLEERFRQHHKESSYETKQKRPLYSAIRKYGISNFSIQLIDECEETELGIKEKFWVAEYNSYFNGYNATTGGDGRSSYDWDSIIESYSRLGSVPLVSQEIGCSYETVRDILKRNNIKREYSNERKTYLPQKQVGAYKNNNLVATFESQYQAGLWLKEQKLTTISSPQKLSYVIGRAVRHVNNRKTAYGFEWRSIENL